LLRRAWLGGESQLLSLGATAGLVVAVWNWYSVATASPATLVDQLSIAFGVWMLIWLTLSTIGGSGADPLKPEVFRLLPLPSRTLTLGLLGASTVGVLPVVTLAGSASLLLAAGRLGARGMPVAIVALALSFVLVIALAKVVELAVGMAVQSRVGLE